MCTISIPEGHVLQHGAQSLLSFSVGGNLQRPGNTAEPTWRSLLLKLEHWKGDSRSVIDSVDNGGGTDLAQDELDDLMRTEMWLEELSQNC